MDTLRNPARLCTSSHRRQQCELITLRPAKAMKPVAPLRGSLGSKPCYGGSNSPRSATREDFFEVYPWAPELSLHTAIDGHSRLAYSELLGDERKETAADF